MKRFDLATLVSVVTSALPTGRLAPSSASIYDRAAVA